MEVKAYLNGSEEIRKFHWNMECNFPILIAKLHSIFNIPQTQHLRLRWKDNENEYIEMSSQNDLEFFLHQSGCIQAGSGNVLKLFLLTPRQHRGNDYIHEEVECSACEASPVYGNRFRCIQCRDYNLCESCFARGDHRHHDMLTLRSDSGLGNHMLDRFYSRMRHLTFGQGSKSNSLKFEDSLNSTAERLLERQAAATPTADLVSLSSTDLNSDSVGRLITSLLSERGIDVSYSVENSPLNTNTGPEDRAPGHIPMSTRAAALAASMHDSNSFNNSTTTGAVPSNLPSFRRPSTNNAAAASSGGNPPYPPQPPLPAAIPQSVSFQPSSSNMPVSQPVSFGQALPPRVINSRAHMVSMGFSDDNGWLTALLLQHDGDISKCLDDIQKRTSPGTI